MGEMRCIVPAPDQIAVGICPVKTVRDYLDLVICMADILRKLKLIPISQNQVNAEMPIVYSSPLAPDLKLEYERIRDQPGLDDLVVVANACHLGCLEHTDPFSQSVGHLNE